MTRRLADWIEGWENYVSSSPSPVLFRRWTGIALIAGAMERKCWVRSLGKNLYPNLYTVLVAPPGVGKSFLIEIVSLFWSKLGTHHVAPDSVSRASLADELKDAERHIIRHGEPTYSFNSLLVASEELGTLLTSYENEFMATLNKLYDNSPYGERKRGRELKYRLERPQLNFLAGTQPSYLSDLIPEGAWQQGFMSRTMLIYSGEMVIGDLSLDTGQNPEQITDEVMNDDERDELINDLKLIASVFGNFTWTTEAAEVIEAWYKNRGEPAPDHPKLTGYNVRRGAHLIKLCQVASMSESDKLEITIEHLQRAMSWLTEAEEYMPDIFKAMSQGGDGQVIKECYYFVYKIYIKGKNPIQEYRIIRYLQERTPSHNVERIMTLMVKGKLLVPQLADKTGPLYIPGARNV